MECECGGIHFGVLVFHFVSIVNLLETGNVPDLGLFVATFILFGLELVLLLLRPSALCILLHAAGGLTMFLFSAGQVMSFPWFMTCVLMFNVLPSVLCLVHAGCALYSATFRK